MIYFIGDINRIEEHSIFIESKELDEAISEILKYDLICEDIETKGLDFTLKDQVKLIQLGTPEHQYVFSVVDIDVSKLSIILDNENIEKILANVYFERNMLHSIGITISNTFCVLLATRVLRQGRKDRYLSVLGNKAYIYSLAGIYKEYLDIDLKKEEQSSFLLDKETYTVAQIMYAARDVELYDIHKELKRRLVKNGLLHFDYNLTKSIKELVKENKLSVTVLEQKVSLYFADMLYNGIHICEKGLIKIYNKNIKRRKVIERELNNFVISKYSEYSGYIKEPLRDEKFTQYCLFGKPEVQRENKVKKHRINWNSATQVRKIIFKELDTIVTNKYGKETVSIDVLGKPKYLKNQLVKKYIEYSKLSKLINTYGEKYLRYINIRTGRIHAGINQVLETGRISLAKPNLAQIPSTHEWRSIFTAQGDNMIVGADYSAQESQVMADKSKDSVFINFFQNGDGDSHSMVASKVFSVKEEREIIVSKYKLKIEIIDTDDEALKLTKDYYPKADYSTIEVKGNKKFVVCLDTTKKNQCPLRFKGKILNFFISYGGSAYTLSNDQDISLEEAEDLLNGFWESFKELKIYFDNEKKLVIRQGYIITNNITNRRRWLPAWKEYRQLENEKNEEKKKFVKQFGTNKGVSMYFDKIKDRNSNLAHINRRAFRMKGEMERESMNNGIQGTAADMTKTAAVLFMEKLGDDGYDLISNIRPTNFVHDELKTETEKTKAEYAASKMEEAMEEASQIFNTALKIKATPYIAKYWQH